MNKEVTNNKEIKEEVVIKQPRGMLKEILKSIQVNINGEDTAEIETIEQIKEKIEQAQKGKCNKIVCNTVKEFVRAVGGHSSDEVIKIMNDLGRNDVIIEFEQDGLTIYNYMSTEEVFKIGSLIGETIEELYIERVCKYVLSDKKVRK